jgi:hypothetical protein
MDFVKNKFPMRQVLTKENELKWKPILKKIREENGDDWTRLSDKCRREQKGVYFVLIEYGHPKDW